MSTFSHTFHSRSILFTQPPCLTSKVLVWHYQLTCQASETRITGILHIFRNWFYSVSWIHILLLITYEINSRMSYQIIVYEFKKANAMNLLKYFWIYIYAYKITICKVYDIQNVGSSFLTIDLSFLINKLFNVSVLTT